MNFARRLIRIPGHDEVTAEDEHQEANDLAYHVANQIEQELRAQYELRSEDDSKWTQQTPRTVAQTKALGKQLFH